MVNAGDTAWVLVSAALVMFMTPGLAFFYGGLVRSKNVLSTLMHCFMALGIVTVLWVVIGHTLAFGPDVGKVIGKGGRIARSLRTLVRASGAKAGERRLLEIVG